MGFSAFQAEIVDSRCDAADQAVCGVWPQGSSMVYTLHVTNGFGKRWEIEKDFSDFSELHKKIQDKFWFIKAPPLTSSNIPTSLFQLQRLIPNSDAFKAGRLSDLRIFLKSLMNTGCYSQSQELRDFLLPDAEDAGENLHVYYYDDEEEEGCSSDWKRERKPSE
eukprot:CAMPEP_0181317810 /NCGR_PEP_ID=MMETSP1101-20121128/16668_1 /TAXON_ID=46948 /ORGANISM="Rhodomonas abbreviata, Strain Caron Lab Isolate" /LENGTH=163 /DNA_ID=CAMNT_0023425231 /DNA_START=162 /DNA_END=653 /DNA_ORIENTATION=-